ncbi:hypothetical protein PV325_002454 [Microctonus aethiopoides]|nr:hypothetical protein PV325_002454 [Microctonus aethiopoides]
MGTQTCVYCIARVGNTPIVETRVEGRHYRQPHLCIHQRRNTATSYASTKTKTLVPMKRAPIARQHSKFFCSGPVNLHEVFRIQP